MTTRRTRRSRAHSLPDDGDAQSDSDSDDSTTTTTTTNRSNNHAPYGGDAFEWGALKQRLNWKNPTTRKVVLASGVCFLALLLLVAVEGQCRRQIPDSNWRPSNALWVVARRAANLCRSIGWYIALVVDSIWQYIRDWFWDFFALLEPVLAIVKAPIYVLVGALDYLKQFYNYVYGFLPEDIGMMAKSLGWGLLVFVGLNLVAWAYLKFIH